MATVYSRVMELQDEGKFPFKLSQKRIQKIGRIVREYWEKSHDYLPPMVKSIEATGIFNVADYPSDFTPEMDIQIFQYIKLIENIYHSKRQKAQNQLFSSSPTPIKRKRKRLPGRPEFRMSNTG